MKTLKVYKDAMAKIKSLAENNDELAEALAVVETGVDSHVKALNAESKGHREGKRALETTLLNIGENLELDDDFTADDITTKFNALKSNTNQTKSESDARLKKLEKTLGDLTKERDDANANALKLKQDNDLKTIKGAVNKELGSHNILEVHRELLADRFASKLTIDADGDIITSDGDTATDLVKSFADDPNNKGLIGTSQKAGGGGTPNEGGSVTESSYRGNLDAVVASMKK
jgi:hypothetical protein